MLVAIDLCLLLCPFPAAAAVLALLLLHPLLSALPNALLLQSLTMQTLKIRQALEGLSLERVWVWSPTD